MEETGEFSLDPGGLEVSTGRDNLVVRAFESLRSGRRHRLPAAQRDPAGAGPRLQRRGDRRRPLRRRPPLRAGALQGGDAGAGDRSWRDIPTTSRRRSTAASSSAGPARTGRRCAARFDPPEGLEGIVVIPPEEVSTERAREAIPAEVPLADAVANVSAAALLVLGLRSADLDLVARGLADRIHQPRRRDLYPRSMEIVDAAAELGALGATISGAGPTVARLDHLAGRRQRRRRAGGALRRLGRGPPPALHAPRRRRPRALRSWTGSSTSAWSSWRWAACWAGRWSSARRSRSGCGGSASSPRSGSARSTSTT